MPELERDLREVGRLLVFPPEPELVPAVRARLGEAPRRFPRRRVLVLALAPHVVMYFDSKGRGREKHVRIAGNVLVWAYGSVTLRIEGPLTEAQALGLARSIR